MKTREKRTVVVAVAPVGTGVEPPSRNPLSPEEVAEEVVRCARAGASMVHLHVRDRNGEPTADLTEFSKTLDLIREESDIVIQGSTGGVSELSLEERCVSLNDPRVEVASLNMGSANFGEGVYINTLPDIRFWAGRMRERGIVPELEVFEAGMIFNVLSLAEEGVLTPPHHFNFCLGFKGALPGRADILGFLASLLPQGSGWGLVHESSEDFSLLSAAIGLGASVVRTGFEDTVFLERGKPARNNVELVERLVSLVELSGARTASPAEARALFGIGR